MPLALWVEALAGSIVGYITQKLTADVAGPLSPGLDSISKGMLGRNLKYLMVAKYMVPQALFKSMLEKLHQEIMEFNLGSGQ